MWLLWDKCVDLFVVESVGMYVFNIEEVLLEYLIFVDVLFFFNEKYLFLDVFVIFVLFWWYVDNYDVIVFYGKYNVVFWYKMLFLWYMYVWNDYLEYIEKKCMLFLSNNLIKKLLFFIYWFFLEEIWFYF